MIILHEINNPGNLGALMRSALWFGFTHIILSANSVDYTNPKAVRASMGSLFHLTIVSDVDLIAVLPQINKTHYLVGSDVRNGVPPHPLPKKAALLLGSESHGLPAQLLAPTDERWIIPGNAQSDSLSLPQAAAIMMYEMTKKVQDSQGSRMKEKENDVIYSDYDDDGNQRAGASHRPAFGGNKTGRLRADHRR